MSYRHPTSLLFRAINIACSLLLLNGAAIDAQAPANPPIQVVRVSYGDVAGLKLSIGAMNEACRAVKHLPPQDAALPSDEYLSKFPMIEVEELFDGQRHAEYTTQRQIGADANNGCKLVVFASRSATSDLVCASRIAGSTPLLGELMDLENPSSTPPVISEEPLGESTCHDRVRPKDTTGLALVAAGGTSCFWNGELIARRMAKFTGGAPSAHKGFDVCLYADLPDYYYQGAKEPVVLMAKVFGAPAGGDVIAQTTGATGAMSLKSFSATKPIPKSRFERSAVEAFVHQPTKTSL